MQELILWGMVPRGVVLSILLRLDSHRQYATKTAPQQEFAWKVQGAASLFRNPERRTISTSFPLQLLSGGLKPA
jgi:hypothetical protein